MGITAFQAPEPRIEHRVRPGAEKRRREGDSEAHPPVRGARKIRVYVILPRPSSFASYDIESTSVPMARSGRRRRSQQAAERFRARRGVSRQTQHDDAHSYDARVCVIHERLAWADRRARRMNERPRSTRDRRAEFAGFLCPTTKAPSIRISRFQIMIAVRRARRRTVSHGQK